MNLPFWGISFIDEICSTILISAKTCISNELISTIDEADRILNSMESINEDILKEKRVARKLEKENSDIQNRIKELEMEYRQNEEVIKESSSNCYSLEKIYDEEKGKLTLIEETIKTIRNSKERAKIMIQNLAPNLKLDDPF